MCDTLQKFKVLIYSEGIKINQTIILSKILLNNLVNCDKMLCVYFFKGVTPFTIDKLFLDQILLLRLREADGPVALIMKAFIWIERTKIPENNAIREGCELDLNKV